MTEAEFNSMQENGNVNFQQPATQPDDTQSSQESEPSFNEYEPFLQQIRSPKNYLKTAPTFTPKSFVESVQYVDDGTAKKPYFYINGQWISPSPVPGLSLVKFVQQFPANQITISGLDLNTDKAYKIFLTAATGVTVYTDKVCLRLNNDGQPVYSEGVMEYPGQNLFNTGVTRIALTQNPFVQTQSEILLTINNGQPPIAQVNSIGINGITTASGVPYIFHSGHAYFGSGNITSLTFYTESNNTQSFDIRIYKLATQ